MNYFLEIEYSICRSNYHLKIEYSICRSNYYLKIEYSICRSNYYLETEYSICKSNKEKIKHVYRLCYTSMQATLQLVDLDWLMRQNISKRASWKESLIDLREKLFGYWQID